MKTHLLCILLGSFVGVCAELYVSPTGKAGGDGSAQAPFATIAQAAKAAKPGDSVHILRGLYREQVVFKNSGTKEAPITYMGERGADGEYLTIIEAPGQDVTQWQPAPEVHARCWSAPWDKAPQLLLLDGKMVALIYRQRMELPRWKQLPGILETGAALMDKWGAECKRLPGLDLMALPEDIEWSANKYDPKGHQQFFPMVAGILAGWTNGRLYLRLPEGDSPDKHRIVSVMGNGFTLENASHLHFKDLHLRGSRCQFRLKGKDCAYNKIDGCLLMHGGARIHIERESHDNEVTNCRLTLGFIRSDLFKGRYREDIRGHYLYLIFKYIIGASTSDDNAILTWGSNTSIHHNYCYQGLKGLELKGIGTDAHHNLVEQMSSVGICTSPRMNGRIHHNLVRDCGILVRIHNLNQERCDRQEYIYNNLLVALLEDGTPFHVHVFSYTADGKGYDPKSTEDAAPARPEDIGSFFIYHNTIWGGREYSGPGITVTGHAERFKHPVPLHFINNAIKQHGAFNPGSMYLMAGNVFYSPQSMKDSKTPIAFKYKGVPETNTVLAPGMTCEVLWPKAKIKGFPNLTIGEDSPLNEKGIDVSKPFVVDGKTVGPLPGFAPGYFKGKAPAAGACQTGESLEDIYQLLDAL